MRARIIILLSQVKVVIREVKLSNKPKEMITASKKGTVPVLLLSDGNVIDESLDVMNWALNINDPKNIKKTISNHTDENEYILEKFDTEFKYHLDRYKYYTRYNKENRLRKKEDHRDIALEILGIIENKLSINNAWIFENEISFTDIAILPFVRQYRIADVDWFDNRMPLKKVHKWLMQFLEWKVFKEAMHKYELWDPSKPKVFFGKDI